MRLSEHDRLAIRAAAEVAGPDTRVFLFGSRTRDDLRGGDIDLLVELAGPRSSVDRMQLSVRTAATLQRLIGERKIDVLVADPLTPETPLLRAARSPVKRRQLVASSQLRLQGQHAVCKDCSPLREGDGGVTNGCHRLQDDCDMRIFPD